MENDNRLEPTVDPRCGTYAGVNAHRRRNEYNCENCRIAKKEYSRIYYLANRQKFLDDATNRQKINPEAYKARIKAWHKANPEKSKAGRQKWLSTHREVSRALARKADRKRRAIMRQNHAEPYTEKQVLDIYGNICHLCGIAIDLSAPRHQSQKGWENALHIDHVIPISKGGADTLENVRPSHGLCNIRKGNRG